MKEDFINFLWKNQNFSRNDLKTTEGKELTILNAGIKNSNSGPDYSHARIITDGLQWSGQVELHVRSSEWKKHGHHLDRAYDNVILHVVYEKDENTFRTDGTHIPTLELKNRLEKPLMERYHNFLKNSLPVEGMPCTNLLAGVTAVSKIAMLDKALVERLEEKADWVYQTWLKNQRDWEETAWKVIGKSMGFSVNSDPFLNLADSIPLKILKKHSANPWQIESLILGQAGWLQNTFKTSYLNELRKEYLFLRYKYNLKPISPHTWKFLRMRPSNFPVVRAVQLATLIGRHEHVFSDLLESDTICKIRDFWKIEPALFWREPGNVSQVYKIKAKSDTDENNLHLSGLSVTGFSEESIANLTINAIIPLLVCFSKVTQEQRYMERVIGVLENLPPENNVLTRKWKDSATPITNAHQAQAVIGLVKKYCHYGKCLECTIGNEIVSGKSDSQKTPTPSQTNPMRVTLQDSL
ncbi:MAG: hypothetical protein A3H98_03485 [Bacteroidetes bacterium RIFCSPLOWO2_02_FULL_36_8]|nr:MAG: hypothetical protein A3H98_03485 [Bacteroidetes bacterium RIFCSPLOWO2_02_FULL_36_8]OFY69504.1 MAG: hypothetical protein A3G23_10730 [Bacteroidetes bacterium RIFCSPLOWO2_12_FULL_37_12]